MMKKLRKPILLSGLFLAGIILSIAVYHSERRLPDQLAAERWSSDGTRYTQVSVFMGGDRSFSENDVNSFRVNLSQKLEEASLKAKTDSARLWIDAYSKEMTGTAEAGRVSEEVQITAVKGDFFQFHPLELVSGYYFRADELMNDRVIIDETLAWKLFGSPDIVGMDFELNGKRCIIAGVVKNPSGKIEKQAYGSKARVYAPMELTDAQDGMGGVLTGNTQGTGGMISCYEVLVPNPVKGFGKKIVTDYIFGEVQVGEEELAEERQRNQNIEVVENTVRFEPLELLSLVKSFGLRSMRENEVKYPYWENIARVWEDYGALSLLVALAAYFPPMVFAVIFLRRKWKNRKWRKERLFAWLQKKRDESWEKKRRKEKTGG